MRQPLVNEFTYQVFALMLAFILVHGSYVAYIRPNAEAFAQQQAARLQNDPTHVPQRSFFVVLKDYEQEACLVLMLWALAILGFKGRQAYRQQGLLGRDLLGLPEGLPIGQEDSRALIKRLLALPAHEQQALPARALLIAIERFAVTANVQHVASAAHAVCASAGDRMESELSTIRYIAWAIPSVGFIGTVRGIGDALGQAHRAVAGDITGVTASLGVAFNSTFIALVISIVLMFFIHQVQLVQERLVLDTESYVDQRLVRRLRG
jgi:biopolymer transport protein ExbB/TolQ